MAIQTAKDFWRLYKEDDLAHHSAAIAYYALFAVAPFLIILLSMSNFFLGAETTESHVIGYVAKKFGTEVVAVSGNILNELSRSELNAFIGIMGILIFLYAVSKFFEEVRKIFFRIFKLRMYEKNVIKRTLRQRVFSVTFMILTLALTFTFAVFNIFFSSISSAAIVFSGEFFAPVFHTLQYGAAFFLTAILFATLFRVVSGGAVSFYGALWGGLMTALSLLAVNGIFALYIKFSISFSIYGAAGFLVALMLWLYYAALAVFAGAEVSKLKDK